MRIWGIRITFLDPEPFQRTGLEIRRKNVLRQQILWQDLDPDLYSFSLDPDLLLKYLGML